MTVWTFYNHGTTASSLKNPNEGEIINLFGNNDRRPPFRGKIINEGVGSIGDPDKIAFEFSRDMSGTYSVTSKKSGSHYSATRGLLAATGGGVQDNVDNAVQLVLALNLANCKPEAINMIGWSRGAVTCIRIAWKLWQVQDANIRNIPINIFAVDPVAGAGHTDEIDASTLTPNVKNYLATLATGEKRGFFLPIAGQYLHVMQPDTTLHWVLPMPGHHSDTAKNNNNVGKIVFNLAYRFLNSCNTPIPAIRHYSLSNLTAWKLYEEIITGTASVNTTGFWKQLFMGGFTGNRDDVVRIHDCGENFFPNVHARKVFAAAYPATYDAYFSPTNIARRNTPPWGLIYSPRIVAEQRQNGMSTAMIRKLDGLKPNGQFFIEAVPAIDLMIGNLRLID